MRRCPIPQCGETIPFRTAIMCPRHWGMVPPDLRQKITARREMGDLATRRGIALVVAAVRTVGRMEGDEAAKAQLELFPKGGNDGQ